MCFLFLWSRDLSDFKLFVSRPLWSRFQVSFELNCCGCTFVCESSKHRLSIPLVEALDGPIDDNKEPQRTRGLWLLSCFGFMYITFP